MQDYWYNAVEKQDGAFKVVWSWTYEHCALGDCFDETVSDLKSMIDRCERGIDTHYIARVQYFYDGVEMGVAHLGSCYAYNCSPEDDIKNGMGGYVEDMEYEARDEAQSRALEMVERLKRDFLEVA